MLDSLVSECRKRNITTIYGYYYRTKKNNMVSTLFEQFGFESLSLEENGDSRWKLDTADYTNKNEVIKIKEKEEAV